MNTSGLPSASTSSTDTRTGCRKKIETTALRSPKNILRVVLSRCGTQRPFFEPFKILARLTMSLQQPLIYATAARPLSGMRPTARSIVIGVASRPAISLSLFTSHASYLPFFIFCLIIQGESQLGFGHRPFNSALLCFTPY